MWDDDRLKRFTHFCIHLDDLEWENIKDMPKSGSICAALNWLCGKAPKKVMYLGDKTYYLPRLCGDMLNHGYPTNCSPRELCFFLHEFYNREIRNQGGRNAG